MASKKLNIVQDDKAPVPVDVLAKDIRAIAHGMRALRKGPLKDNTLVLLVNQAIPAKNRPGTDAVRAVLDGIESLEETHLKKPSKG